MPGTTPAVGRGGVIAVAAVYQFTPLKDACLREVPQPDDVPRRALAARPGGALDLGVRHGGWCLGCCWALMAALFALGVMSIGWMALIAAFIAGEKLLPWPRAPATRWRCPCSRSDSQSRSPPPTYPASPSRAARECKTAAATTLVWR